MYQISPNIVYQFRLFPLTLFGYFTYKNLEYTDRLAEHADESYKTKEQIDETYTSLIGAKYALNENWAVTCQWEHVDAKSNNDNETTYSYDYWSDAYSIGLSVRF
jgi:opacity protein-like surface antigen